MMDEAAAEAEEKEAALDDAYVEAADAFDDADFGYEGELSLDQFMEAMKDPAVIEKISKATHIPTEELYNQSEAELVEFFRQIDTDFSGTVSFNEWVNALVKIRATTFEQEKEEEKEIEAEVHEAEVAALDAFQEGDEDWSGELEFDEFLRIFKSNKQFVMRVAKAANVPLDEILAMTDDDIGALFDALDGDYSGTISFDEFVRGIVAIRLGRREELKEAAAEVEAEEAEVLDDTYMAAAETFDDADFDFDGVLTRERFHKAITNEEVIKKLSEATHIPEDYFVGATYLELDELFDEIDTNGNGTIEFDEWVNAMVSIRQQTFAMEKEEEEDITREVRFRATQAFKDIFKDELGTKAFIENFKKNDSFISSVASALNIPKEEISTLAEEELMDFFKNIDVDASGSVSYDEFVDA